MWGAEATFTELSEAGAQRDYTFRVLVRALHLAEFPWPERIAETNQWAAPNHRPRWPSPSSRVDFRRLAGHGALRHARIRLPRMHENQIRVRIGLHILNTK